MDKYWHVFACIFRTRSQAVDKGARARPPLSLCTSGVILRHFMADAALLAGRNRKRMVMAIIYFEQHAPIACARLRNAAERVRFVIRNQANDVYGVIFSQPTLSTAVYVHMLAVSYVTIAVPQCCNK